MMKTNPLSGIAMIGAELRKDFDLVENSLCQVHIEDQLLIDSRDRAEAFRRAESVRILYGDEVDVMVALDDFVHRTIAAKKGIPYTARVNVIPFRRKQKPLPKTLDAITVGRGQDWTEVDGLLGEMKDYILATSRLPNPPLAAAASFSILSAACGRRLYTPTGACLSLYVACLGDTGIGKDRPLKAIQQILHAAGLGRLHQTASAFTISGLEQILIDSPVCVATVDEMAVNFLARMTNKRASVNESQMKTFFLSLFGQGIDDGPYQLMKRSRVAMTKGVDIPTEIPSPSLSLFGASTPEAFYENLTGGNIADGFMNRFLIAPADPRPEKSNDTETSVPVPADMVDWLKQIAATGNGARIVFVNGNATRINPRRIGWSDYAKERHKELEGQIQSVMDAKQPGYELLARVPDYALRLASLFAISRLGPNDATIEWPDIDHGAAWALESAHAMIEGAANSMSRSEHEAKVNVVKGIIRKASRISRNELVRATQQIHPRERDAIVQQLTEGEMIGVEKVEASGRGRKPTVYFWCG